MTHSVKDLSSEQKLAIESLLGRRVSDDEQISITTVPSKLTREQRAEALEKLDRYFAHMDAHRQPVSEEEEIIERRYDRFGRIIGQLVEGCS